ncbi:hypothetical protein GRI44_01045 [Altererythrobacter confluentis]|uniref:Uncharacterized protein n=1 Tax=Allopontixanthobacter confluentis TaxID=1849021 RepID=A0A6L7GB89_9SPHN|nr:hypothetical protein [Allopontixanthobacter confluentis]MXP13342.1 hypothetical protein [Allopontixanthobacter confluentis]
MKNSKILTPAIALSLVIASFAALAPTSVSAQVRSQNRPEIFLIVGGVAAAALLVLLVAGGGSKGNNRPTPVSP